MAIPCLIGGQAKFLSDEDIRKVHCAVLSVLEEVGVRVDYRPALELFRDSGCRVGFDKRIVHVPEHLLRKALATAPSRFTLRGKSPEWDVPVDLDRVYTIGGSCALDVLDLEGVRRRATLQDLVDLTRLQDGLENLHIMHSLVVPQDIEQRGRPPGRYPGAAQGTASADAGARAGGLSGDDGESRECMGRDTSLNSPQMARPLGPPSRPRGSPATGTSRMSHLR